MKKLFAILSIAAFVFAACGNKPAEAAAPEAEVVETEVISETDEATVPAEEVVETEATEAVAE